MIGRAGRRLSLTLAALFLIAPIVVVAGISFDATSRMAFPPEHPDLHRCAVFMADPAWTASVRALLTVAARVALLSMTVAFPVAHVGRWYGRRYGGRAERVLRTLGSHGMVFAALPPTTPELGFAAVDPTLMQAARTMGARDGDVLGTVVLPNVRPYLVSGLVLVFVLRLNQYTVADTVSGFSVQTMPIKVFNNLRMGFQPMMCVGAVLCTLIGIAAFTLVAAIGDLPKLPGGRA